MAGETILIVEDVPESLKFTAGVLRADGYKVTIASTAEQGLSTLRFLQPELILVDFVLPGMHGLELVTRIKQDARLQNAMVVALTACDAPGDEAQARQAGCDGYLTKPIAGRELVARVRDFLHYGKDNPASSPNVPEGEKENGIAGLADEELAELQESFLKGGRGLSLQLLASLDAQIDLDKAGRTVHQWIGTAGLLGFPNIAYRARDVEVTLRTPPCTVARLRGPLTNLARAFQNPTGVVEESASQSVVRVLSGKRVALIGLSDEAADLMCGALEQVGAKTRLYDSDQSPYAEAVGICHVILVHVRAASSACRWLSADAPALPALPTIFWGTAEDLLALDGPVQARASGLMMDGCLAEEALMRLRLAITQPSPPAVRAARSSSAELVIAVRDEALRARLGSKMEEMGLRCRVAASGPETIVLLRHLQPPVAVVDVDLDGFEVLAAIRAETMAVRAILVTAQSQEEEILRGFTLGAEDYLVQPFGSLELVARVKRILG